MTAPRDPSGDVDVGDPVAFTATRDRRRRRHAHLRVGLRRRRHLDRPEPDAHLRRGRASTRQGDRHRRARAARRARRPDDGRSSRARREHHAATSAATSPFVLALTISGSATFGPFTPGVTKDYTDRRDRDGRPARPASAALTVVRSGRDATPASWSTARTRWPQPLQVRATNAANPDTAFAPVTGAARPLTLLSYPRAISADPVTIGFKQSVGATRRCAPAPTARR